MILAQNLDSIQSNGLPGFKGGNNIGEFFQNSKILEYVFGAAAIALLIYLIMGGFQMMTSQGDPKAMQGAQGKITNAFLGFAIIIISFFVIQFLGQIFGLGSNEGFKNIFGLK